MTWQQIAHYAHRAPSPHNTQPVRLRIVDDAHAQLVFVSRRGLSIGDPEGRFAYATFGIFEESLRIAAHRSGYELQASYVGELLYQDDRAVQTVAELELSATREPVKDLDPELLLRRRTNRHPYDDRPVPDQVVAELGEEARKYGHRFEISTDREAVQWVKELNRDSLYHDLEQPAYRRELASWLRYSEAEAQSRGDGLSPGALVLPGWLMRGMMRHHRLLSAPLLRQLTQRVYMSTMSGISTVGWVQGDFVHADDWIGAGQLMLRMWVILTRHGVDWQPYGSVITNDEARRGMVKKFGMSEGVGGRDMVWLLVRLGYAKREPVRSARLPLGEVVR